MPDGLLVNKLHLQGEETAMSMTDPIADMLTRIRNAVKAEHKKVEIPASGIKKEIARILKEEGYIDNYKFIKDGYQGIIRITLRYHSGKPSIRGLERLSKPGRRLYAGHEDIPKILHGLGIAIISTSKGVLTDMQARKLKVGGELICAVW